MDVNYWAAICEQVSERNEPPICQCPNCHALSYNLDGVISCSRGCVVRWAGENGPWVVCVDGTK